MSTQYNHDEQTINFTRRQALKGLAAGGAAAAVGVSGVGTDPAAAGFYDDTANTVGLSFSSPGLAVVEAASGLLGWTAGDSNEAATEEIRKAAHWDAVRYHNSLKRELALNSDLLEYAPDGIFSDAKLKGIEKLNNGATQSEVETAMISHAETQMANIEKNIIEAGNQAMKTLNNYFSQAIESDATLSDIFDCFDGPSTVTDYNGTSNRTVTLLDGSEYDIEGTNHVVTDSGNDQQKNGFAVADSSDYSGKSYSEIEDNYRFYRGIGVKDGDGNQVPIIPVDTTGANDVAGNIVEKYDATDSDLQTIPELARRVNDTWENDLKPDIQTWAANAYDAYASGDVAPEDLLTASDISSTISEEEPANRAIAHLRQSGIGVDPENPATIETTVEGGTLTVEEAVLGSTGTTASLSVGDTVDPSTLDYEYMLSYGVQNVAIEWPHYASTLDGGIITINQVPAEGVTQWLGTPIEMVVQTSKGETATFNPYEYGEPESPNTSFDVDLSDQLDEPIADVSKVTIFSAKSENVTASMILDNTFTLTDGAVDQYDFSHDRNIQTTDNYVTAEEWQQRNEDLKETIEELREEDGGGATGGGGGGNLFGGGDVLPTLPGLGVIESAVVVALGFLGINALTS